MFQIEIRAGGLIGAAIKPKAEKRKIEEEGEEGDAIFEWPLNGFSSS